MAGGRVHFRTFAAGKNCWRRAAKRLVTQSHAFDLVQTRVAFEPTDLNGLLGSQAHEVLGMASKFQRGFGLWAWKLPLLLSQLREIPRGDTLMYLDAGSSLNFSRESLNRFEEYIEMSQVSGSLFFQQDLIDLDWTKHELRRTFPEESDWKTGQLLGGIVFLSAVPSTVSLLAEANDIARERDYAALLNPEPGSYQEASFRAHRHDQSVLSLTAKRRGGFFISDETYHAPHWELEGANFPIWASRLCSGNPNLRPSLMSRVRREVERRLPF